MNTTRIRRLAAGAALTVGAVIAFAGPAMACNDGLPHPGCPPVTTTTTAAPTTSTTAATYPAPPAPTTTTTVAPTTTTEAPVPATVPPAPAPRPPLPNTGAGIASLAILGAGTIAAGAILVRRTRAR